ncbi:MAG: rod shape-determining protein MreD, partial [Elusimicrobia bacterium]|nr:rod shape-determining protein MreD [Elusimicrobiota bacterium]
MKKFLRWAAFFAGAAVLDWWSGSFCVFYGSSAEIMMLAVICASAFSSPRAGQAFGFLSGLYIDFMGAKLFGGHALLFVIIS